MVKENKYISYKTEEIWKEIEGLYLEDPDLNKIMKQTGIPASLIRDAVSDQLAKRLKGGEEIWNIATLEDPKISKKQAIDIVYACRTHDGLSVDVKKAKKFLSFYKSQDFDLRMELIRATKRNPGASMSDWIEFAENKLSERSEAGAMSLGALSALIRKNLSEDQERINFLTDLIDEVEQK
tara:strand:- start:89 stop:631 length:543 start_codon:yes stop_codon:yes gene_type:complete